MPDLRVIGFWVDDDQPHLPDPADFVDPSWNPDEREAVAAYLRGGKDITPAQGCSACRICGEPNGFDEFTDGVYLWPEGLAHYVWEHAVRLPDEVLKYALRSGADVHDVVVVDRSWWASLTE